MQINFNKLFRPATSLNGNWNLLKTTLQSAIFWLVFLYFLPQIIIHFEASFDIPTFSTSPIIGWSLLIAFSALNIYCGYTMSWYGKGTPLPLDCPQELVIQGPYRFVRNPMAVAGIGQGVSVGIILGSYLVVSYALFGAILWHLLVRPIEEKDLSARFGEAYIDYQRKVKCWIPRFN